MAAPKSGKPRVKGEAKTSTKPKSKGGAPKGNKNALGNSGGVGGPAVYTPEYAEKAFKIALLGATDAELADIIGVNECTIHEWKKVHVEFAQALEKGKITADSEVAASLYKRATGFEHEAVKIFMPAGFSEPVYAPYREYHAPDTGAAAFWLKNRRRMNWRDKQDHEITGKDGGPVQAQVAVMSAEEFEKIAKQVIDDI